MTHNPFIRHNVVLSIGLANASATEEKASVQRILGCVIRRLSRKFSTPILAPRSPTLTQVSQ